uniref:Uncharacterized protein LOC114334222 n=1 Tax=Diabrotica virgifera virgifera TaxID=50390 RepID=A0A6P7FUD9_DIAVI
MPQFSSYQRINNHLKLLSIEKTLIINDLLFLHKILEGNITCPDLLELINFKLNTINIRDKPLFSISFHHTNYGYNSPIPRFHRLGNEINKTTDLLGVSQTRFKNQLGEYLM